MVICGVERLKPENPHGNTAKPKPQDPHGTVYTFIEFVIADAVWFLPESAPIRTMLTPTIRSQTSSTSMVYVDDIIFGSTNPDFSKRFANLMKNNFEISMMGKLKFFFGLQVHQSPRGIFISHSQYAIELLKKHSMDECVSMSTPMATERLNDNLQGTPTERMTYHRRIGGLMYLTSSRPDIAFATFVCARYQARPTVKHLKEDKRIFRIAASSSAPWIYLGQFWHTLNEDGSNYRLKFVLDMIELTLTLDDFKTIFHLPQATENNHDHFVPASKFSEMVPFYINDLGFTLELRSPSNFNTPIMQMLYCFVNNIHVDYSNLLWEGFHYSLEHPPTLIPYPRFTKLIVSHYMTTFPKISRQARNKYHNLEDDEMVKSIFNSGKHKDGVRMKIQS
uniref:Uncharacterized mitochondrial protein AtMg00810-like n=1 Tax=Tanacetum cinerariifolium TaxID=118510 RepID=A0A699IL89_TANCI|nr:uncharacterized mitochondrial protein AtMg00810-like [Tanacetum cinerariifolium]